MVRWMVQATACGTIFPEFTYVVDKTKAYEFEVQQALDWGYELADVYRDQGVAKVDAFTGRITVISSPP